MPLRYCIATFGALIIALAMVIKVQGACSSTSISITETQTVIQTDHNYDDNEDCEWTLTASSGKVVQITFTEFSTEACCDKVEISLDGSSYTESLQGATIPTNAYVSDASVMKVKFTSDASVTEYGFKATVTAKQINVGNDCKPGEFQDQAGVSSCKTCAPGQWSNPKAASCYDCTTGKKADPVIGCINCAKGTFQNETGKDFCHECPTGLSTSEGVASCYAPAAACSESTTNCPCRGGYCCKSSVSIDCNVCNKEGNCVACLPDYYFSASNQCTKCPNGKHSDGTISNVNDCDANTACAASGVVGVIQDCKAVCNLISSGKQYAPLTIGNMDWYYVKQNEADAFVGSGSKYVNELAQEMFGQTVEPPFVEIASSLSGLLVQFERTQVAQKNMNDTIATMKIDIVNSLVNNDPGLTNCFLSESNCGDNADLESYVISIYDNLLNSSDFRMAYASLRRHLSEFKLSMNTEYVKLQEYNQRLVTSLNSSKTFTLTRYPTQLCAGNSAGNSAYCGCASSSFTSNRKDPCQTDSRRRRLSQQDRKTRDLSRKLSSNFPSDKTTKCRDIHEPAQTVVSDLPNLCIDKCAVQNSAPILVNNIGWSLYNDALAINITSKLPLNDKILNRSLPFVEIGTMLSSLREEMLLMQDKQSPLEEAMQLIVEQIVSNAEDDDIEYKNCFDDIPACNLEDMLRNKFIGPNGYLRIADDAQNALLQQATNFSEKLQIFLSKMPIVISQLETLVNDIKNPFALTQELTSLCYSNKNQQFENIHVYCGCFASALGGGEVMDVCQGTFFIDGTSCTSNSDCRNEVCKNGKCCGTDGVVSSCLSCSNTGACSDCDSDSFLQNGKCISKITDGNPCASDSQCNNNVCKAKCCGTKGQSTHCTQCSSTGECSACNTGYELVNGQCAKSNGDTCSSDSQCDSNVCKTKCCGTKGQSTHCTQCSNTGECSACSTGYELVNGQCTSKCIDTTTTDASGDGCDWYDSRPNECGSYDDDDFVAKEMCCSCKGASTTDTTTEIELDTSVCFPPWSTVMLKGGVAKRLDNLDFGDIVQDSPTTWSTYYFDKSWNHREIANQTYVSLSTKNGFEITLSKSHLINIGSGSFVEAQYTRPGIHRLVTVDGLSEIVKVKKATISTHYSPYTYSGKIMVNGISASCYAITDGYEMMDTHKRQHEMNFLMRLTHRVGLSYIWTVRASELWFRRYLSWGNLVEFSDIRKFWEL